MNAPRSLAIKLDQSTRERLQRLAKARDRSAHWMMREAIAQYLEREERRETYRQDAIQAWQDYQATGLHLTEARGRRTGWPSSRWVCETAPPESPRLIWSPAALRDVQRLHRFLAEGTPRPRSERCGALREGTKLIAAQPGIGHPVPDFGTRVRERIIPFGESGYVLLCRLEGETAAIVAIRHQREAGY